MNLLTIAKLLTPEQRLSAYEKQMRPDGDRQFADALRLADPAVVAHYADRHPTPGQLLKRVTTDASGRKITTYHGDSRAWRRQFDAPGMGFVVHDPRKG